MVVVVGNPPVLVVLFCVKLFSCPIFFSEKNTYVCFCFVFGCVVVLCFVCVCMVMLELRSLIWVWGRI